jgi:hypothetical protein
MTSRAPLYPNRSHYTRLPGTASSHQSTTASPCSQRTGVAVTTPTCLAAKLPTSNRRTERSRLMWRVCRDCSQTGSRNHKCNLHRCLFSNHRSEHSPPLQCPPFLLRREQTVSAWVRASRD